MNMPRMQGDEAIQNIKDLYEEKRRTYAVKLLDPQYIILTAFLDLTERVRLNRQGNIQVYEKPLDLPTLKSILHSVPKI